MKRRILSIVLSIAMVLTMMPAMAVSFAADEPEAKSVSVEYLDENGVVKTAECTAIPQEADDFTFEADGWYVLDTASSCKINNRIVNKGTESKPAHLILTRYGVLYAYSGISNPEGGCLNIYQGKSKDGYIIIGDIDGKSPSVASGNAGIGGDNGKEGGTVNLYGGKLEIMGGDDAVAINGVFNYPNELEVLVGPSRTERKFVSKELYPYTHVQYMGVLTHSYGATVYEWNDDLTACVAYRSCTKKDCQHLEFEIAKVETVGNQKKATFVNKDFKEQIKDIPEPVHEHEFSNTWSKNSEYHWHVSTCGCSGLVNDYEEHNYSTSISKGVMTYTCDTCGYEKKETLKVSVPKTSIKSLTRSKKAFTVKWTKKSVTGYEIQYATNSSFTKGKKTVRITKDSTVIKKFTKLRSGRKYYVRVRCYTDKYDKRYYSSWTTKKSVIAK